MLADGNFISISQAAKSTPYTAEYLSLLARKGRLKAVKINRDWITTPGAISEYLERQARKHQKLSEGFQTLANQQAGFAGLKALILLGLAIVGVSGFLAYSTAPKAYADQPLIHQTYSLAAPSLDKIALSFNSAASELETLPQVWSDFAVWNSRQATGLAVYLPGVNDFIENLQAPYLAAANVIRPALAEQGKQVNQALLALGQALLGKTTDEYLAEVPMPSAVSKHSIYARGKALPPVAANPIAQTPLTPEVLGESTVVSPNLTSQIETILNQDLAEGEFTGPQGLPGASDLAPGFSGPNGMVQNGNGVTTSVIGGTPIVSYIPSSSSNNYTGGSLAGFTNLSSQSNVTNNQTITNQLTVDGPTDFNGQVTLATTTINSLAVTGNLSAGGNIGIGMTAPITQLDVAGAIPSGAVGSVTTGTLTYSVYVQGRYAYVTNYTSDTLQIFDISNPVSPVIVGSVAISASYSVYVQGHYAYVAGYGSGTLQIVDVSNPASPVIVGSVATGSNPRGVYVQGRYAYVINRGSGTLQIVDVSNPAAPVNVGSVATGVFPLSIYVQGRYAYVANYTSNTLQIFDVSNPAAPVSVGSIPTGSGSNSVYVQGRYAYVANRGSGTLQIVDVSNPASPTIVGSASTGSSPVSVYVQGRYAYVANSASNTLQIVDVSNPAAPVNVGSASTGNSPYSVYVQGRYAYVVNSSSNTLQVFDVGGAYIQQLETGGIETGTLNVRDNLQAMDASFQGGVTVGQSLQISQNLGLQGNAAIAGSLTVGTTTPVANAVLTIATSTTNLFTVLSTGNVGIGTISPTAMLFVQGTSTTPLLNITASSSISALYVSNLGNVGIGSTSPIATLSVQGSSILPTTPIFTVASSSNSQFLTVLAGGNVGIGSTTPKATLVVQSSINQTTDIFDVATQTNAIILSVGSNGNVGINSSTPTATLVIQTQAAINAFEVASTTGSAASSSAYFMITAAGNVGIGTTTPGNLITLSGGAYSNGSSWSNASDVNLKENFATVSPADILQKIDALPITQWNYKADPATTTHIGPTAEDFYAAFGLNGDGGETSISTIDPAGVALLGIKALDQKITALQGALTGNVSTSTLTISQPVVYQSSLTVLGQAYFSGDSVGEAKLLAGATSVRISFSQAYQYQPIVTVTPEDFVTGAYRVASTDASGFSIEVQVSQPIDISFNWHSFASPNAQLTVSDGTMQGIVLIISNSQSQISNGSIETNGSDTIGSSTDVSDQTSDNSTSTSVSDSTPTSVSDSSNTSIPPNDGSLLGTSTSVSDTSNSSSTPWQSYQNPSDNNSVPTSTTGDSTVVTSDTSTTTIQN